jgi:riboflavin synthase
VFTGITEEIGKITQAKPDGLVITASRVLQGMNPGESVAVNGACLTVTSCDSGSFTASVMPETLGRTNLGRLRAGDEVNLERAMALGGKLGGHLVQGHVDDVGKVASLDREGGALIMGFTAPIEVVHYIVVKGFITVDGVSLTVVTKEVGAFRVSIVDYTRKNTTLGGRLVGDLVNLEVDIIAKYVAEFSRARRPEVTVGFLKEHGFLVGED